MGGAAVTNSTPSVSLVSFNAARGFVGGAALMSYTDWHALMSFNAARGFVGGAALVSAYSQFRQKRFQCRTRLCGWCSHSLHALRTVGSCFNAARGFVGGAAFPLMGIYTEENSFNAARGFVGGAAATILPTSYSVLRFNAARGFVGGAAFDAKIVFVSKEVFQCRTRLCGWCSHKQYNMARRM